jgi:hypothetical protein
MSEWGRGRKSEVGGRELTAGIIYYLAIYNRGIQINCGGSPSGARGAGRKASSQQQ